MLRLTVVHRSGRSQNPPLWGGRLTIEGWVTILAAKLAVRAVSGAEKVHDALRQARTVTLAAVDRAKMGGLRLQRVLQERENRLVRFVADSRDPMIVTGNARRVLDANAGGLALLGVSEANIRNFTIDAFVPSKQAHMFEPSGPPFVRGAIRQGECRITRLDGKSVSVGFSFQPNVILGRHVARFQYLTPSEKHSPSKLVEQSTPGSTSPPVDFPF